MDELKCTNSDRQLQLDCMKLKTIDEIYAAIDTFPRLTKEFGGFMFTPSMDNDFFPDTIQNMIKKAKVKPGIIGFSDKESLDILVNSEQLKERFPMPAEYNEYNLITALKQLAFNDKIEGTTHGKVYEFYNDPQFVLNFPVTHEISLYYLDLLTKITSDILINMPLLNEIELKRATGWPIYLFNMEYANDNLQPNSYPIKGPSHSTFLLYLLQNKLATNEDDKYLVNTFLNSFSQFVKTDSPSTKDQMWPKIDSNRPSIHVAIKRSLNEIKNSLLSTRHNFWKNELKFDGHITIPYKAITISESTHTEL
uniref:COesterase domain-containing protein n=1 Tax=Rhabditophanes sp. KR3021 TaxID=114890 RepID=A0AC35TP32_9BILA